ncbi:hypothetical protein [Streptomyces sp. NPDC048361]
MAPGASGQGYEIELTLGETCEEILATALLSTGVRARLPRSR